MQLIVLDRDENLVTVLDIEKDAQNYNNAVHKEQLNFENTFKFRTPAHTPNAIFLEEGFTVGFKDRDGNFQFFEIKRILEIHGNVLLKEVFCEHQFFEEIDQITVSGRLIGVDIDTALDFVLDTGDVETTSRWQRGNTPDLGTTSIEFNLDNRVNAIIKILQAFADNNTNNDGNPPETKFRTEFTGNTITGRFIDVFEKRGEDTGKRFEFSKDIKEVRRDVDASNLKTALYGFGRGQQSPSAERSSRVTFRDVEWLTANGDPADKPAGQTYIEDPDAKAIFGRRIDDTTKVNRFGIFSSSEETNEAELLRITWERLQDINEPILSYKSKVADLEEVSGLEFEKVRLGDIVRIIDNEFNPALRVEARVIELRRHLLEPERDEIILGNFLPLSVDENETVRRNDNKIEDESGLWGGNKLPTNLLADGSFENVLILEDTLDAPSQSFNVDETVIGQGTGNWQFDGNDKRVVSVRQTDNIPQTLFGLQGAFVSSQSKPFQTHSIFPAVGFEGPYTFSVYISAYEPTDEDGTALIRYVGLDIFDDEIIVEEERVQIRANEKLRWKRIDLTLVDLPSPATEILKVEILVDETDNPNLVYVADGAQVVQNPDPVEFQEPQITTRDSFSIRSGSGVNGDAFLIIRADEDDTSTDAEPFVRFLNNASNETVDLKLDDNGKFVIDNSNGATHETLITSGEGVNGDNIVIIEADADNANEDANVRLLLRQDGGLVFTTYEIDNLNNILFDLSNEFTEEVVFTKGAGTNGSFSLILETDTDNSQTDVNPDIRLFTQNRTKGANFRLSNAENLVIDPQDEDNEDLFLGVDGGGFNRWRAIHFRFFTEEGVNITMDDAGSGTAGTEPTIRPTSDQFGFVGTSSFRFWEMWASNGFNSSSIELKDIIGDGDIENCYQKIKSIKLKRFKFKREVEAIGKEKAQERISPVSEEIDDTFTDKDKKGINTMQTLSHLIGANQKLMEKVEKLEEKVKKLEMNNS